MHSERNANLNYNQRSEICLFSPIKQIEEFRPFIDSAIIVSPYLIVFDFYYHDLLFHGSYPQKILDLPTILTIVATKWANKIKRQHTFEIKRPSVVQKQSQTTSTIIERETKLAIYNVIKASRKKGHDETTSKQETIMTIYCATIDRVIQTNRIKLHLKNGR